MQPIDNRPRRICRQFGGAALEYVVVSAAALLIASAGVTLVVHLINARLESLSEQVGVPYEPFSISGLLGNNE